MEAIETLGREILLHECASYFSCCCEEITDSSNRRKEDISLAHSLRVQPMVAGM